MPHTHWRGQRAPAASLLPLLGVDRLLLEENQSLSAAPVLFHSPHTLKWSTWLALPEMLAHISVSCSDLVINYTLTIHIAADAALLLNQNVVRPKKNLNFDSFQTFSALLIFNCYIAQLLNTQISIYIYMKHLYLWLNVVFSMALQRPHLSHIVTVTQHICQGKCWCWKI